ARIEEDIAEKVRRRVTAQPVGKELRRRSVPRPRVPERIEDVSRRRDRIKRGDERRGRCGGGRRAAHAGVAPLGKLEQICALGRGEPKLLRESSERLRRG